LPVTIDFHEKVKDRRPSPPPRVESTPGLSYELPNHASAPSLLKGNTPPQTPKVDNAEDIFAQFGSESQGLHSAVTPGNRRLMRSDVHLPEWGQQGIFNQPKSRAKPLPSNSILDFSQTYDDLLRQRHKAPRSRAPSNAGSPLESPFNNKTWTVEPAVQGNGGLTNAAREAAEQAGHDITWVGTVGFPTDSIPSEIKEDIEDTLHNEHNSSAVFVKDKDLDGHYSHFCKTILWPIFHYQVPDHPKSKAYADHSWNFYFNLNQAFADKVMSTYKKGDTIWVHDYHLLLVPGMIRKKIPDAKIGFFLHTAFPSSEVFRCLARRRELLEGMLGANLVGFQTSEYSQHFLQTCSRILTVETTAEGVQLEDHFVNVLDCPIGINLDATNVAREAPEITTLIENLKKSKKGKRIIVARDQLDNIRGVRQKLLAYELFLNKFPEWRNKVVLIQVATSTSEQSELLATVSDIVTRIESTHSTLSETPLVFLKQDISFNSYIALLTAADTMMITPLRDGMNLTAHEFIACQDGARGQNKHAPLILSEFTGSASVFGEYPLVVNPWNYQEQANAIKTALEMTNENKEIRWRNLHKIVAEQTGGKWARTLSDHLDRVYDERGTRDAASVPRLSVSQVSEKYKESSRRVFILDYEGTLAPHRTSSGIPLSSPQRVLDALNELLLDQQNIVYVMSGRKPEALASDFRTVPRLGLIAENGCFVREFGDERKKWIEFANKDDMSEWKSAVRGILKYYQERLEHSFLEERHCSMFFRFNRVDDKEAATRTAGECSDHINGACSEMGIRAVPIPNAVLIETIDQSKAKAAEVVLKRHRDAVQSDGSAPADFLMVAGDDREDEVIFRWANEIAKCESIPNVFTVSVGKRNTEACATLTQGTTGLLSVLGRLAKISGENAPVDYFNNKSKA
jgi:trehalose-phosphatase